MADIVLKLVANPGLHRIGLWDNRAQTVVAVSKGVPRYLAIGDEWRVPEDEELDMVYIRRGARNEDDLDQFSFCLVPV